jgi:hypothetical protein
MPFINGKKLIMGNSTLKELFMGIKKRRPPRPMTSAWE